MPRDSDGRWTIGMCGAWAVEAVSHPQRGVMNVCERHAKRIQRLPSRRFRGVRA